MRWIFAVCLLAVPLGSTRASATQRSFTSDRGVLSFLYSRNLVRCSQNPSQPDLWVPVACGAYGPVCGDAGRSTKVLACFAYPPEDYKGTNFQAAAFSVAEITSASSKGECLAPPPNGTSSGTRTIHGVSFTVVELDGAGLGNDLDGHLYLAFYHKTCYALSIRMWSTNPAVFDPGSIKVFTEEDRQQVFKTLQQSVETFRFLR